jgi:hypothetical protein
MVLPLPARAFTYVTSAKDAEVIVHPVGYEGRGGELVVTLGLHPDFRDFEDEVTFSAEHAVAIWNALLVWEENLEPSLEIPALGGTDFFGTLVHETGHTLGLGHPTHLTTGQEQRPSPGKFSFSQEGPNGKFDLDEGPDGIRGTSDDERGDDVNAVFFKKAENDPFTLPEDDIIDSTTYSRELEDLPSGHGSPAVPTREAAAALFSRPATEAMMVSGGSLVPGRVRRGLGVDDVAGIRYAMSGLDEIQGTADDYTIRLEWVGLSDDADIMTRFDLSEGYASAAVSVRSLSGNHRAMGKNRTINYNPNLSGNRAWYFPQPVPVESGSRVVNARALEFNMETKPGVRYGISWPLSALQKGEEASGIIVQLNGTNRSPMSGRLFLFVAEDTSTNLKIAFPSVAPELDEAAVFQLTARQAN